MDLLNKLQSAEPFLWPIIAIATGLMGSAHCLGMCGGIVVNCSNGLKQNLTYQLGRLLSYQVIGILMFFLGKSIVTPYLNSIAEFSVVFFSVFLVYLGVKLLLKKRQLHFFNQKIFNKIFGVNQKFKPFLLGSASILLPCHFLYSFLFIMVLAPNVLIVIISIAFFWLGTAPILIASEFIVEEILKPFGNKFPKIIPVLLICLGVYSLSLRINIAGGNSNHCHRCHNP